MKRRELLLIAALGAHALSASGQETAPARAREFELAYRVDAAALPLDSVELWFRTAAAPGWRLYGHDHDRQSPFPFKAENEGLHDFFLVLTNAAGPSSQAPGSSTEPHVRVLVDATPPVLQVHEVRAANVLGQRTLQIRWTAIDAHLPARPIELSYRVPPDERWNLLSDPVANSGGFDWRVPDEATATVAVRVAVVDEAGHHVLSEPVVVDVRRSTPEAETRPTAAAPLDVRLVVAPGPAAVSGSKRAKELAEGLLQKAVAHRERREFREGIARLREAVRLDPELTAAFAELGSLLYAVGDPDRALSAYRIALEQQPKLRSALAGAARVYTQKKDYGMAADRLRAILRYDPGDAEMWLALGDVSVYQGDEMLARECYMRASQVNPEAAEVIAEARKRLALMSEASRAYEARRR